LFGFLNINKPEGITSFDVIAKLRKITGVRQIGHTGTLDPFASGVLPVCIGKAAKLINYLNSDKEYLAEVQFGAETDTYDLTGKILKEYPLKVYENDIIEKLKDFEGEIEQLPPIYSAIKVNGRKLYEYARNGEEVGIKPRKVTIYKINLISFNNEKQTAKIHVRCSKGTYIRSIAYELGKKLNTGGYLISLQRTMAGNFEIKNSVNLNDLKTKQHAENNLINPITVMPQKTYLLNEIEKNRVIHGMSIKNKSFENSEVVFLIYSDKMYAAGLVNGDRIEMKKVFEND